MNPATDILPGANRDLFSVGHGVTIADADGAGIAVCPLDHPLVSLDRPGCWRASKDAAEFTPKKPVVYLNLYNNQWNTNFRYWYPGTWSSRVRLWTFDAKTAPDAVMATPALEARNPLLAVATTGQGGKLPAEQSGLSVSRKGVLVTAFGAEPRRRGHAPARLGTGRRLWRTHHHHPGQVHFRQARQPARREFRQRACDQRRQAGVPAQSFRASEFRS